jgi:hypothetical protein
MKNRYTNGVRGSQIVRNKKIFFSRLFLGTFYPENVMVMRFK